MKAFTKLFLQVCVVLALIAGVLGLGLQTQSAAASSTALYVLNGGTLNQTAGTNAVSNSITSAGGVDHIGTPTNPQIYTISGLNGTYDSAQSTAFNLYVDANTGVGAGVQAQVQYDMTGDGTWDRTETYNYFPTDPVAGSELYTQAQGLSSSSGTFANLSNGKVRIQVWNAIGNVGTFLRVSATSAQGQQSTVTVPFALGGGGPTATNTNTLVGPTPTRTNTPSVPTATNTTPAGCGTTNIALNKTATSSSNENAGTTPNLAVDGNGATRWSSIQGVDPQWIYVDLGSTQSICRVVLTWEAAYASAYQIQVAAAAAGPWTNIYSTTTGNGATDDLTGLSGSGRYVRMNGTVRGTAWGYSLWEFAIYAGTGGPTPTNTAVGPTPTKTNTPVAPTITPTSGGVCGQPANPNFGSSVRIFDPGMSAATIQAQLDADFNLLKDTQTAQFSENRRAHLFKPGTYNGVYDNVGFYTSVAGLGINPTDVTIVGAVTVDAFNASDAGNATQNFWRSTENLTVNTSGGADRWAVAQAAPFRRMNIIGGLDLFPASFGWASGGYIADSKVSGVAASASQQQWYSRDSNFGSWSGSNWNMVFSGVSGAPGASFPTPPMTVLGTTPVSRDVPYLYVDGGGAYRVFLPNLRTNASGSSWPNTPGTSLPMSQFYVVMPGTSAATINNMLNQNCNLFFTPGVFHINQTINVNNPNTVVLGIGYPTIVNDSGVNAMQVANVDGVRLKGLLFDAGTTNAAVQLTIGTQGNTTGHASNPVSIQDVFFRIGGQFAGKVTTSLIVNSYDTIIDHIWAWRADHGAGIGWTANTADTGLIVNGNNVIATGLFVEHYQKYEVMWNGQNGKIIFYQNEMPYDPPNQASWMNGSTNGYAAIKVATGVTTFEAWGLGSYCFFNVNPAVVSARAFEAPNVAGVKWHNLSTVSLGNVGMITNVINTTGPQTPTNSTPATVTTYP